jgi:hypothetical protein
MQVKITEYYANENVDSEFEGVALFDDHSAEIRFDHEGHTYSYKGQQVGDGQWFLKCEQNKRSASLYKSVLEQGCYEGTLYFSAPGQSAYRAMWYIEPLDEA